MKKNDTIKSGNLPKISHVLGLMMLISWANPGSWVAPPDANELKNPVAVDATVLNDAHKLYTSMCSPCHGYKGKGDGPVANMLNPHPSDHTSAAIQNETDGSLYWKMTTGKGVMQSYKTILTDQQRWSLVSYIRTLAQK